MDEAEEFMGKLMRGDIHLPEEIKNQMKKMTDDISKEKLLQAVADMQLILIELEKNGNLMKAGIKFQSFMDKNMDVVGAVAIHLGRKCGVLGNDEKLDNPDKMIETLMKKRKEHSENNLKRSMGKRKSPAKELGECE